MDPAVLEHPLTFEDDRIKIGRGGTAFHDDIKAGEATIKVWPTDNEEPAEVLTIKVVPTSTSGGISVNLDEVEPSAEFTIKQTENADGSITLTATPAEGVPGYEYRFQWLMDKEFVDGGTAPEYIWTADMLEKLGAGNHQVMVLIIHETSGTKEYTSARTTITVDSNDRQ